MILWRCQFGNVESPYEFSFGEGACGKGIYAMLEGANNLRRYYSARGENTFVFEVPDNVVKNICGKGLLTYWSIRERIYLEQSKGFKVFVCKHKGINIPTGKQVLITDPDVITNIRLWS